MAKFPEKLKTVPPEYPYAVTVPPSDSSHRFADLHSVWADEPAAWAAWDKTPNPSGVWKRTPTGWVGL